METFHSRNSIDLDFLVAVSEPCCLSIIEKRILNSEIRLAPRGSQIRLWARINLFHIDNGELETCLLPWLSPKGCY